MTFSSLGAEFLLFLHLFTTNIHAQELCPPTDTACGNPLDIAINGQLTMCNEIISSCPGGFPGSANCVQTYCQGGPVGPCDPNCCSQPDPHACLNGNGKSSSGTISSDTSPSSPTDTTAVDPALAACSTVAAIALACDSLTPSFSALPNTVAASCFCYDGSGRYSPDAWDVPAASCYGYLSSMTVTGADKYLRDVVGACTKFVDVGATSVASAGGVGVSATGIPASGTSSSTPSSSAGGSASKGNTTPAITSQPTASADSKTQGQTSPTSSVKVANAAAARFVIGAGWKDSFTAIVATVAVALWL